MGTFTARKVQSLVKEANPGRFSDGNGLYLMIPKNGISPYWMLRYTLNRKRRELTLGQVEHLSLSDARSKSVEAQALLRNGVDPIEARKREGQVQIRTVDDLFQDWHVEIQKRLKHPNIPERIFTKEISPIIGSMCLESVKPMDVRDIIRKVVDSSRPSIANDTLMYLKQLFNHGVKLGLLTHNPASAFSVNDAGGLEKSRNRALSLDELDQVFRVFREHKESFTRENYLACALLLVLGVRKSELIEAPWSEFDLDQQVWKLPNERSKSGVGLVIPLPNQVVGWFKELKVRACGSPYVFPNRRSSMQPHMGKDTLNRAILKLFGRDSGKKQQPENKMGQLEAFTVHDLRRTCRSLLAESNIPGHVAERCLNHKLKGVEGIYDRYDYFKERKQALEVIANLIEDIV